VISSQFQHINIENIFHFNVFKPSVRGG